VYVYKSCFAKLEEAATDCKRHPLNSVLLTVTSAFPDIDHFPYERVWSGHETKYISEKLLAVMYNSINCTYKCYGNDLLYSLLYTYKGLLLACWTWSVERHKKALTGTGETSKCAQ